MTTTIRPTTATIPPVGTTPNVSGPTGPHTTAGRSPVAQIAILVFRLALGWIFLWPFLDKTFGWGYSTAGAKSWINGGSPTKGFLGHVEVGPLQSMFRGMAGNVLIDWLFMLTLLGVGVALVLGVVLRIAAISGSILLILMWAAEWPLAQHTSGGAASGSTNPFLDYHLVFAIGLVIIATLGTASARGLGKWWCNRPIVAAHQILR